MDNNGDGSGSNSEFKSGVSVARTERTEELSTTRPVDADVRVNPNRYHILLG